jgi:hypothetical protein
VTLSPTKTVCTYNCTQSYAPGESVQLAAIADPGWWCVSWSGDPDAGVSGGEQSLGAVLRTQKRRP